MARFGCTARRTAIGLFAAVCLLLISDRMTSEAQSVANGSQRVVGVDAMRAFLKTLAAKRSNEYREVSQEAQQRLPRGTVLERFPESVSEQLPQQGPVPMALVKPQLEREGFNTGDLKAVTIFKGDTGAILVDIVVVLRKDTNVVTGVYSALWGR